MPNPKPEALNSKDTLNSEPEALNSKDYVNASCAQEGGLWSLADVFAEQGSESGF